MIVAEVIPALTEVENDVLDSIRRGCRNVPALVTDTGRATTVVVDAVLRLTSMRAVTGTTRDRSLQPTRLGLAALTFEPTAVRPRRSRHEIRAALVRHLSGLKWPTTMARMRVALGIGKNTLLAHLRELEASGVVVQLPAGRWRNA